MPRVRKIPQRMCIGCREMKPKKELIRVVRTPEAIVTVDATGKLSGRGAYVCPRQECLNQALTGKRLDKALKQSITPDVVQTLRERMGLEP